MQSRASPNDPENIRKTSEARLQNQKKIPADFLSIKAGTNEHGAFRTSAISCPQRCTHFSGQVKSAKSSANHPQLGFATCRRFAWAS
jgi:hypothetical protein